MGTYGRFLTCVAVVLTTAPIAAAQAPRDGRSGKEAEAAEPAPGPVVPGFGNEFEARPVPGFGAQEEGARASSDALSPISRGKRAAIRLSPPALTVRSLGTPLPRAAVARPVTHRFHTAAELLPEGLPDWFRKQDANGDGQVAMAEYTTDWNDAKVREYRKWDLNNDGVIEPSETLKVLGIDATRQAKSSAKAAVALPRAETLAVVKPADLGPPPNERRVDSLVRIFLMRYDRNGSGALEEAEWPALPWRDDLSRWDTNHDRRLTADELAARLASPQR